MQNQVVINCSLTQLNDYIRVERGNKYKAAQLKHNETSACAMFTKTAMNRGVQFEFPCYLMFEWHVKNKRKDPDNIAFAQKFVLDGFQEAGFLENDGMNNILGFIHTFVIDKEEKVIVTEVGKEKFEKAEKIWFED